MSTAAQKICLIDDDEAVRDSLRLLLETHGMDVEEYASASDFLPHAGTREHACLLLDLHMPGMNGLELLESIRRRGSAMPVIMISGRGDPALCARAKMAGASAFLNKPVGEESLLDSIRRVLAPRGLRDSGGNFCN